MLYGAGVPNEEMMKNAPHVGIATVWWEGNPVCYRPFFSSTSFPLPSPYSDGGGQDFDPRAMISSKPSHINTRGLTYDC